MEKVIVTGANGFLGAAMVSKLSKMGVTTYAVVKEGTVESNKPNVTYIKCCMEEIEKLPLLIEDRDIDCVFYFAWNGSAGPVRSDYTEQLRNIANVCDAVKVAKEMNCRKFIFASSIMEYEVLESFYENIVPSVSNMYSVSKLAAHHMSEILAKNIGIDFIPVIISNVFGEGENSPRLINTTIKKLIKGEKTAFTPGEQMYDFLYIKDAIDAFIAVAEKGKAFKNYYLGSKNPKPLKDFLIELAECFSPTPELGLGQVEFNGVSVDYYETFDVDAIENDTGFVPQYTFKEGIKNTIAWIKERMGEYNEF